MSEPTEQDLYNLRRQNIAWAIVSETSRLLRHAIDNDQPVDFKIELAKDGDGKPSQDAGSELRVIIKPRVPVAAEMQGASKPSVM
jgi:hypothetical protein